MPKHYLIRDAEQKLCEFVILDYYKKSVIKMSKRDEQFACKRSQKGDSLRKIGEMLGLSKRKVTQLLSQGSGLTTFEIERILCMSKHGLTLTEISADYEVSLSTLKKFLPDDTFEGWGYGDD
jgi:hypothetical protein